ncbi:putative biotin synthase [Venustampulla echinocandica]|uniref:Putative biotin synthase n=1 Tax=Venustampulla echinocandica TaxID=2656787 RepID=A0A370TEB5_9HELO|nr:putative biotin synthase [Venustampulla echinocandica]RDL33026.1 putative biotin synthase [Venustampulla echinocandica]
MRGHRPHLLVKSCRAWLQETKAPPMVRAYGAVSAVSPQVTTPPSALDNALAATAPRTNWTKEEIKELYDTPLMQLAFAAASINWTQSISSSSLRRSAKADLTFTQCAQSSRYQTGLKASKMVTVDSVLDAARIAKENGSTRFCMGAAWRDMRGRKSGLRNIKAMVNGVRDMGMEVCVTLGMIDLAQAKELKEAGLTAYNHNVDTSRDFYPSVISTRTYDERLQTIQNVRDAGLNVCTGGILGLGEKPSDHVGLIHTVATLPSHPESFPVNTLVPIKGTPMGDNAPSPFDATLRTIATARVVMPRTIIRLAAGRTTLSEEQQILCFMAGANAVFTGEKMLTTACNGWDEDRIIFDKWGLRPMESFEVEALRELVTTAAPLESQREAPVVAVGAAA